MPLKGQKKKDYMKKYEKQKRLGWGKVLVEALGGICNRCGGVDSLELDHRIPLRLGGKDNIDNVQVLCEKCHQVKTQEDKRKLGVLLLAAPRQTKEKVKQGWITSMVFCDHCRTYVYYQQWLEHTKIPRPVTA